MRSERTDEDPLRVATKGFDLDNYRLVETGFDTGIFTGEVILTGFAHDPTGDGNEIQFQEQQATDQPMDIYRHPQVAVYPYHMSSQTMRLYLHHQSSDGT